MKSRFRQVVLVIIDELSMTDQVLLGGTNAASGSMSSTPDKIMGGKHLLMVGDWFQLPPVGGSPCFSRPKLAEHRLRHTGFNAYTAINFVVFLTENMRSRSDQAYTELLSDLRLGRMSDAQLELLNSRVQRRLDGSVCPMNEDYYRPIVVPTNKLRCAINTDMTFRVATRLNVPIYECSALPSSRSRAIVENLANANDDLTDHIPIRLLFHIGMPVMITRKHPYLLDADVIAKGVLGRIVGITPDSRPSECDGTVVNGVTVYKFREQPRFLLVKILSSTKTFVSGFPPGVIGLPTLKATLKLDKIPNLSQASVTVQQFTVVPAFACTTEKLQGQTCRDGIIVTKLERAKGIPHQTLYVALSRSVSLDKVTLIEPVTRDYLRKFNPTPPTMRESRRLASLVSIPPYASPSVATAFRAWIDKQI